MIRLTKLNGTSLVVNADLIEHIDITPDTVVSMTTGQRLTVRESVDEVVDRVIQFRRLILQGPGLPKHETESSHGSL